MTRTAVLLGAALALGVSQPAWAGTETIATTGDRAGGTPAGAAFNTFGTPRLNDAGQVAYWASLQTGGGVNSDNDTGLWRNNTLVVREGSQAAGTASGVVFSGFSSSSIKLNEAGQVAYTGFLESSVGGVDFSNDKGLWRDNTLIAREGSQAGGTASGAVFSSLNNPALNNLGQIAYSGLLRTGAGGVDSNNSAGIWWESTLVARSGSQAGGTASGAVFSSFSALELNNVGQVAYSAFLRTGGGGVDISNNAGLWRDNTLIARAGSQAAGTPAGAVFSHFSSHVLNNAGQVAYQGFLRTDVGGVDTSNRIGIWRDNTLIARSGNRAGGTPAGAVFNDFSRVVLNDAGQVAYQGTLRTGVGGVDSNNDRGIWRDNTLLVRRGSQAVGTPAGAVFSSFRSLKLNDGGQVAYEAFLRTGVGGVDFDNRNGIWITGTNGESALVVRQGQALAGSTVGSTISFDAINRFSQVAYTASLNDGGRGVFLYTPDIHWTANFSSSWDTSSRWTIGQLPGAPHDVFIDPDVSLTVTGPRGQVNTKSLAIGGNNGIATLRLSGGSIAATNGVTVTATGVLTGDGTINSNVINNGMVTADNVTINGTLINNGIINGNGRINAKVNNTGRIEAIGTVHSPAELRFDRVVDNVASTGLIAAANGTLRFNGGLDNAGSVAVSNGSNFVFGDIHNTGSIVLTGGAHTTLFDDITNNGTIVVAAAGTATSTAVFFGEVSGSGAITGGGNVFLHGDLRPGNSPAAVEHDADLFFMPSASTQIELGGTTPGTQHDQIGNLGNTTLGGTLDVVLIDGFTPAAGDSFDVFNFASRSGNFSQVNLPDLDNGLQWDASGLYTNGRFNVFALGDMNGDGQLTDGDIGAFVQALTDPAAYASAFPTLNPDILGDFNGDNQFTNGDAAGFVAAIENLGIESTIIPEPTSLALLGLGGLIALRRRR